MSKVREEINKRSAPDDKPILLALLNKYRYQSEFSFVATCTFVKAPYPNNHRIWKPTAEGYVIYNELINKPLT